MVHNRYAVAMEPLGMRNARGFDGLGRVMGALVANEASGRPERAGPQAAHVKGGACGNVTGCLNLPFQCKSESATRPAQRTFLPAPPQGSLVPGWTV